LGPDGPGGGFAALFAEKLCFSGRPANSCGCAAARHAKTAAQPQEHNIERDGEAKLLRK
jgi:hypothetical protein